MGNVVFRRSHTGEMTLIKLADMSNVTWSDAQQAHRQRFKEAVAYAKAAMAEPKVRAVYEKQPPNRVNVRSIWPSPIISRAGICYQTRASNLCRCEEGSCSFRYHPECSYRDEAISS